MGVAAHAFGGARSPRFSDLLRRTIEEAAALARDFCSPLENNRDSNLFAALRQKLAFFLKGAICLHRDAEELHIPFGPEWQTFWGTTQKERETNFLGQAFQVVLVSQVGQFLRKHQYEDDIDAQALADDVSRLMGEDRDPVTAEKIRGYMRDFSSSSGDPILLRELPRILPPRENLEACRKALGFSEDPEETSTGISLPVVRHPQRLRLDEHRRNGTRSLESALELS